jgi:aldose 1-epimerase
MGTGKNTLLKLKNASTFVLLVLVASIGFLNTHCSKVAENGITSAPFDTATDGQKITLYTLKNKNNVEVGIINYGGTVVSIKTPDKNNKFANVVLGLNKLNEYKAQNKFFGALIGRYGNRIGLGKFSIDGKEYVLATNDKVNHLHGGKVGFDKVIWNAEIIKDSIGNKLKLTYLSKDGEEGYPGNLNVEVTYQLTDSNELLINYSAATDKKTIVNLTSHGYFNLAGSGTILNQLLTINADSITPVDKGLIPTGVIASVHGTPFDFTKPMAIGASIDSVLGGYDHNFVLSKPKGSFGLVATLFDPSSGRAMDVLTSEPGLQFYSGNFLDNTITLADGRKTELHGGLCLETQHYPDSPNKPNFPSTILNPGEKYTSKTIYKFYVK